MTTEVPQLNNLLENNLITTPDYRSAYYNSQLSEGWQHAPPVKQKDPGFVVISTIHSSNGSAWEFRLGRYIERTRPIPLLVDGKHH